MKIVVLVSIVALAMLGARSALACDSQQSKSVSSGAVSAADNNATKAPAPKAFDSPPKVGTKATCPVMGGEFTVKENTERSEYKGKHYVFCCSGCKPKFDADPPKYAVK